MSMMHFCGEDTCAQDPLCCEHGDPCDETMCPASEWYGMTAKEIDAMYDPEPEDELAEDIRVARKEFAAKRRTGAV